MSPRLIESLTATAPLSEVFSDESVLQAMLDFESALARSQARLNLIPAEAAAAITAAAQASGFDAASLTAQALRAGTPAIPLVQMLAAKAASGYVHWGATSQDVTDTALVLLLRRCRGILHAGHERLVSASRRLSDEHAQTVMTGRTLLQPAPPITFGLKAAGWLGALERGWWRVQSRFDESAYLEFGGASGTLAALGQHGLAVSEALADELHLKCPDAPWHAHRDRLAALMAALSIYTGSLGKMALDIALLMQDGEAAEPGGAGRGGSSTMPHKHNPTACMLAVAASKRTPGLLANFLSGLLVEHERGLGGWQSEWTTVHGIVQSAGVAIESMVEVAEGLTVDTARMRANIDPQVFAEQKMISLAPKMGRAAAFEAARPHIALEPPPQPENYLGSAEAFRLRLRQGSR